MPIASTQHYTAPDPKPRETHNYSKKGLSGQTLGP